MILSKEKYLPVLKKILEASETPGVCNTISKVIFSPSGVRFLNNEFYVFIKEDLSSVLGRKTVRCVAEDGLIGYLMTKFNLGEVSLELENETIRLAGIELITTSEGDDRAEEELSSVFKMSEGSFKELIEKDYIFTKGNYFYSSKTASTIGIGIHEGELFEVCPGCCVYKLSKFKTLFVDQTYLSQEFGHEDYIFLIPKKILGLLAENGGDVTFKFDEYRFVFENDLSEVGYTNKIKMGTNAFKDYISCLNSGEEVMKVGDFSEEVKNGLKCIVDNGAEYNDDIVVQARKSSVNFSDNEKFLIGSLDKTEKEIITLGSALNFLIENVPPEAAIVYIPDSFVYRVTVGDDNYYFACCE